MSQSQPSPLLDAALAYARAGLSVIPTKSADHPVSPKRPDVVSWKAYQAAIMDEADIRALFNRDADHLAVAIVAGAVSGNLEILDFDDYDAYEAWYQLAEHEAPHVLPRLVIVATPSGGRHVYYRSASPPPGNQKLARDTDGSTLIETRGEGGYALAPPSKGYEAASGALPSVPVLQGGERDVLLGLARSLDLYAPARAAEADPLPTERVDGDPGTDFNARGWNECASALTAAGWRLIRTTSSGHEFWCRPGKDAGVSATFNAPACPGRFYVFSSNAPGLDVRAYDPFGLYARIAHGGDFAAASRDLLARGYGAATKGKPAPKARIGGRTAHASYARTGDVPVENGDSAQPERAARSVLPGVEAPPGFPPHLSELLPRRLQHLCGFFDEGHERDVFLTTALPILAGMMPSVWARHADGLYSPDLYTIVLAEGGGGKGAASWALRLASATEARLAETYRHEKAQYDEDRAAHEAAKRSRKGGLSDALPSTPLRDEPVPQTLLLEADTSAASLKQSLARNEGRGVLKAQEIDTLTQANGREWGGFSDVLRNAWHHETIGSDRKGEGRTLIHRPRLSVMLTGTPGQFAALVPGVENGLFSRLCPYVFAAEPVWKSHRPSATWQEREDAFAAAASDLDRTLFAALSSTERKAAGTLWVDLRDAHWQRIDDTFGAILAERVRGASGNAREVLAASVKRGAVVAFRVAVLLAVLGAWEDGEDLARARSLEPTDEDIEAGIVLSTVWLSHAFALAGAIPAERTLTVAAGPSRLLAALAQAYAGRTFTTADVIGLAEVLAVTERTLERHLSALVANRHIRQHRHGVYSLLPSTSNQHTHYKEKKVEVETLGGVVSVGFVGLGQDAPVKAENGPVGLSVSAVGFVGRSLLVADAADRAPASPAEPSLGAAAAYPPAGRAPVLRASPPASGPFAGVRQGDTCHAFGHDARVISAEPSRLILARIDEKKWEDTGRATHTATAEDVEAGRVVLAPLMHPSAPPGPLRLVTPEPPGDPYDGLAERLPF